MELQFLRNKLLETKESLHSRFSEKLSVKKEQFQFVQPLVKQSTIL